jgi:hypothetical protein
MLTADASDELAAVVQSRRCPGYRRLRAARFGCDIRAFLGDTAVTAGGGSQRLFHHVASQYHHDARS